MYSAAVTTPILHSTDIVFRPGNVEYIKWTVRGLPESPPVDSISVSLDNGKTWHAATVEGDQISLLVAHPTTIDPGNAVLAKRGDNVMLVRFTDSPEIIIRPGGRLHCVKG